MLTMLLNVCESQRLNQVPTYQADSKGVVEDRNVGGEAVSNLFDVLVREESIEEVFVLLAVLERDAIEYE